ncbi:MAG TPA: GntG family PLP-dependent aldolase [Polyangia bacterium]|jgi:threonine aldolase|nr:GntG family PLP-dependent aldolase [Polyangia bacterium]
MTTATTTAAPPIDLRSDTVTRPSAGMRAAMAAAEVGDDVLGEDPTVILLQTRAALLLGMEAALFVPSGTMANQIALKIHCEPGDEVIVSDGAHVVWHEMGGGAALAGVQLFAVGRGGTFTGEDVDGAYKPSSSLQSPTRLVCVENTHNRGGGVVWPRADLDSVVATARRLGLRLHLDGARLMNAAVASGQTPAALADGFDTVSFAFSKGLGAPVGSVIAGSRPLIERAHRFRKMLGGGMRQAGVIAAAALYALDHNVDCLADDHAKARLLGERLGKLPGLTVDTARLHSNIVMVDLDPRLPPAKALSARLHARGVLCFPFGPRRLRLVTHLDVSRAQCERAAEIFADVL